MHLERKWYLPNGVICSDYPKNVEDCGRSIKWMCGFCGKHFAQMLAWQVNKLQVFSFYSNCCPDCFDITNRWGCAGALEFIWRQNNNVPLPVALYELEAELAFLKHPDHPHNKVY